MNEASKNPWEIRQAFERLIKGEVSHLQCPRDPLYRIGMFERRNVVATFSLQPDATFPTRDELQATIPNGWFVQRFEAGDGPLVKTIRCFLLCPLGSDAKGYSPAELLPLLLKDEKILWISDHNLGDKDKFEFSVSVEMKGDIMEAYKRILGTLQTIPSFTLVRSDSGGNMTKIRGNYQGSKVKTLPSPV